MFMVGIEDERKTGVLLGLSFYSRGYGFGGRLVAFATIGDDTKFRIVNLKKVRIGRFSHSRRNKRNHLYFSSTYENAMK